VRQAFLVHLAALVTASGCAGPVIFQDQGIGNGSSQLWSGGGVHAIDYVAADREPWVGCVFGLEIVEQGPDPLSNGTAVATLANQRIQPNGNVGGRFTSPLLPRGDYYLRYTGDLSCEWNVRVYGSTTP
jgi:hypothetical protein